MQPQHQRIDHIRTRLTSALKPQHLTISDESHHHIGHPGATTGQGHFSIEIASPVFDGKPLIECHRMIYQALADLLQTDIHALRIHIKRQ